MTNKVEALNCPNCGAGVMSDAPSCEFCKSRLKTIACPKCFGLMFFGSKHCSHCGAEGEAVEAGDRERDFLCPRCKVALTELQIETTHLHDCNDCGGMWLDAKTFEAICIERERQTSVFAAIGLKSPERKVTMEKKVRYIPCPDCNQLMNRNNFGRASGVIIDVCRDHGVWCDANELPEIVDFIIKGGMDRQRSKEKVMLEEERKRLRAEIALIDDSEDISESAALSFSEAAIRTFVKMIFK